MLPRSAPECWPSHQTKNPPFGGFSWLDEAQSGVAAQATREFLEMADAARLGAVTPVLQLAHQLLAGSARAFPQRSELRAHRVDRVQGARLRQALVEVCALGFTQRFFVAVQPALQALQHMRILRREAAQLAELL